MVTASDVVSALPEPEADGARESGSAESPPGPGAARPRTLSLTGADLSIERDVDRLLASPGGRRHMELACYAAAVLALVFAGWARRRGQIDPERLRRRRALAEQRERVSAAGSMARSEAVAAMAAGLRELLALAPELRDDDCDRFLQECDDLLYAPAGREGEALDAGFQRRALEILDRMGEKLA